MNALFMGTHVVSGTAKALVVHTGTTTEFGKVSERLKLRRPETEFEHGVRGFGHFLMELTLILVIAIFAVNVYLRRPVLDSFLFALALAVGLTPQLLPAIISINLAHGAMRMARKKTIVKRLASIENFGSMNVLCSDKTGTITEGTVRVHSSIDTEGRESEEVFLYAFLNAVYQTGFKNPIDDAIAADRRLDISSYRKLDEVPYDFIRKRLSILVATHAGSSMITKGAVPNVLAACSSAKAQGAFIALPDVQEKILQQFEELSGKGFRVLGIASKETGSLSAIAKSDETGMAFLGFILLADPFKAGINETLKRLNGLGVSFKIVTGDNRLVAAHAGRLLGISNLHMLTGAELHLMSDEALLNRVNHIDIFAEVEPNEKERIILSLKKTGNIVGYLGDGINDAPALHAADVGISVDSAVDVAKETADIVLLEKNLEVLSEGVQEGRNTFSNTLKYVFMATSANFGNMFSMAGASLFLPFLPLLPKQILLTNLMTDFPEMTIAGDTVDPELAQKPRRWDIRFIRKFMLTFGILSSVFDYLTFGMLLLILHASPEQFRTGWFMESVVSACLIVLVIRSRRPFFRSVPGKYLTMATLLVVVCALLFPYTHLSGLFGMLPLPVTFLFMLGGIVLLYIAAAEIVKKIFYKRVQF